MCCNVEVSFDYMSFVISIESISMLSHVPANFGDNISTKINNIQFTMLATVALQIHAVVNNSVVC